MDAMGGTGAMWWARARRLLGGLALTLALAACGVIPVSTLWALRHFDLMTFNPRDLQVLLYLPAAVAPAPDTLKVSLTLRRANSQDPAGPHQVEQTVSLQPLAQAPNDALPTAPAPGGHWVWLALSDADVRRIVALREQAQAWTAADGSAKGRSMEMNVSPQFCQGTGSNLTLAQVKLSAWIRWEHGQALRPLLEGVSGRDVDEKAALETLPRCGTLAG